MTPLVGSSLVCSSRLHYNLGVAYSAQKRHHEAQGAYETAIAKSPNSPCLGVIFSGSNGSNGYMLLKFEKKTSQKRKHGDDLDIKIWMYIWAMNIWNIFIYIYMYQRII